MRTGAFSRSLNVFASGKSCQSSVPRWGAVSTIPRRMTPGKPTETRSKWPSCATSSTSASTTLAGMLFSGVGTRTRSVESSLEALSTAPLRPVPPMSIARVRGPVEASDCALVSKSMRATLPSRPAKVSLRGRRAPRYSASIAATASVSELLDQPVPDGGADLLRQLFVHFIDPVGERRRPNHRRHGEDCIGPRCLRLLRLPPKGPGEFLQIIPQALAEDTARALVLTRHVRPKDHEGTARRGGARLARLQVVLDIRRKSCPPLAAGLQLADAHQRPQRLAEGEGAGFLLKLPLRVEVVVKTPMGEPCRMHQFGNADPLKSALPE